MIVNMFLNIEPVCDDNEPDEESIREYYLESYLKLTNSLSNDGRHELEYLIGLTAQSITNYDKNMIAKIQRDYNKLFADKPFTIENMSLSEDNGVCLVRRAYYDGKYQLLSSHEINSDITRLWMKYYLKKISRLEDKKIIIAHYSLDTLSFLEKNSSDDRFIEFMKSYHYYIYNFYLRCSGHDITTLDKYKSLSTQDDSTCLEDTFDDKYANNNIFKLQFNKPISDIEDDLHDFSKFIKFKAKELQELNSIKFNAQICDSEGKNITNSQFKLWDRYIEVYDNAIGIDGIRDKKNNPKIDKIIKKLAQKYQIYNSNKHTEIRKRFRDDYEHACELIEMSKSGSLIQ